MIEKLKLIIRIEEFDESGEEFLGIKSPKINNEGFFMLMEALENTSESLRDLDLNFEW